MGCIDFLFIRDNIENLFYTTLNLILIPSWSNQMHRMGSLVLMVHDLADHWMELAKMCKYAGYEVAFFQHTFDV